MKIKMFANCLMYHFHHRCSKTSNCFFSNDRFSESRLGGNQYQLDYLLISEWFIHLFSSNKRNTVDIPASTKQRDLWIFEQGKIIFNTQWSLTVGWVLYRGIFCFFVFQWIAHIIFITMLWGRTFYQSYFINDESEAQRV